MHCLNGAVLGNAYISGLVRVDIAVMKNQDQKQAGEERVYLA